MNYRQTIAEAWLFTQENKKLIVWYAFIPSILSTTVGVLYLVYQFYALKSSVIFENWSESFTVVAIKAIFQTLSEHIDSAVPLVVVAAILAIFYFFLPPLTEGGMIQLIARKKNGQDVRIRDGIRFGMASFLPMFEYSLIARSFNIFVAGGEILFVLRNLGLQAFETLAPIFVLIFIVMIIFTLLFIYADYYIVIDNCNIKECMAKSAALVVLHWDKSLMLSIFMIIIAFRIILQIVFVLLVPGIIMLLIYFFAASTIPLGGIIIGGIASILALILASYLGAIVHVFTSSVWVFTFLELTQKTDPSPRETA